MLSHGACWEQMAVAAARVLSTGKKSMTNRDALVTVSEWLAEVVVEVVVQVVGQVVG